MKKKTVFNRCLKVSVFAVSLILALSLFASCKPRVVGDDADDDYYVADAVIAFDDEQA